MGNLLSVARAFASAGAQVELTSDPAIVERAHHLVLPGVGAFADGMRELEERGLRCALEAHVAAERPLLGICLGMQMLLDESCEFERSEGLGLIPGRVVTMPSAPGRRIPRIGWGALEPDELGRPWESTLLERTRPGDFVYFAHSYSVEPSDPLTVIATTDYVGLRVPAVLNSGPVWGTQFHPEKSGPVGLTIVARFLEL